jgi:hypothetical protein
MLNILEYASRMITDEKFVATHLLDYIIPMLQSSGETIDEIFKDLRVSISKICVAYIIWTDK